MMAAARSARLTLLVAAAISSCAAAQPASEDPRLLTTETAALERRIADRQKAFCDRKLREGPRSLRVQIPAADDTRPPRPIPAAELDAIFCLTYSKTLEALGRGDIEAARDSARFNIHAMGAIGLCPTPSAFLSYRAAVRAYAGLEDAHAVMLNLMTASCSEHILMLESPLENAAAVAESAAFALDRRHAHRLPAEVTDLAAGQLAYILIGLSVGARERWARSFMSYHRERPDMLAERGFSTEQREQMVAVATGLSGDWPGALALYRTIAARKSADHEWLNPPSSAPGGAGLMNIVSWPGRIRDETLTALAMAGQPELALCLLDRPERDVAATTCAPPRAPDDAARANRATIRVLTTNLGTLVIGRRGDDTAERPLVRLYPSISPIRVVWRVDGSARLGVLGLVQMLQAAGLMDLRNDRNLPRMKGLFEAAANVAEELAGGPIREMIERLRVPEGGEVTIVTTGAVALLPILAAHGPAGTPLGSRYALSLSVLQNPATGGDPLRLPAAIRVSGGSTDLPNTALELASVLHWNDGDDAPFSSLGEVRRGRPPDILHISNHAGYRPDVKGASAIQLSGNASLTIADVERWRPERPPRLVVLSGCQTGLLEFSSSVRDQRSLARAFLAAGVQGVVASTWPVDDLSTSLLMSKFYDELAAGATPRRALFAAQRWIAAATDVQLSQFIQEQVRAGKMNPRDTGDALAALIPGVTPRRPFADPLYWAGFQLFGS